jgi:hypothetical protein
MFEVEHLLLHFACHLMNLFQHGSLFIISNVAHDRRMDKCICEATTLDRLCGLVVRVLATDSEVRVRFYQKKKVVGLERGPLSLVSTTEELFDRKVAAAV